MQVASWLSWYLPYIYSYLDAPKTWEELQQNGGTDYDKHHVVEQASAKEDGIPDAMIDSSDNLVRIPTFKHWQITGWFQTQNKDFGGLSPRDYLRGRSWKERRRVGLDALVRFGILRP
jgi:hypothetical protein